MKDNEYMTVFSDYNDRILNLLDQVEQLKREKDVALRRLEERCLKEHGAHRDNGAMFFGSCVRCGADLG